MYMNKSYKFFKLYVHCADLQTVWLSRAKKKTHYFYFVHFKLVKKPNV